MSVKRLWYLLIVLVLVSVVFYGCTKERSTNPWSGKGVTADCMGCHGNEEILQDLAQEEENGEDPEEGGDG